MPFLAFNNWTVSVAEASPIRSFSRRGRSARSVRGVFRDSQRGRRMGVRVETSPLEYDVAETLVNTVLGVGHFFDFADGLAAKTMLQPRPGYQGFRVRAGVAGAFGSGQLLFDSPFVGRAMDIDAQLPARWTVVWREKEAGFFVQKTRRGDGSGWDGATQDNTVGDSAGTSSKLAMDVLDGVLRVGETAAGAEAAEVDDLLIYPFEMHSSAIEAMVSMQFKPADLPELRLTGDIVQEDQVRVLGQVTGDDYLQMGDGTVRRTVSFELMSVPAQYTRSADQGTAEVINVSPAAPDIPDFVFQV